MGGSPQAQRQSGETEPVGHYLLTINGAALAYFDSFEDAQSIAEGMSKAGSVIGIRHLHAGGMALRAWTYEPGPNSWVERS